MRPHFLRYEKRTSEVDFNDSIPLFVGFIGEIVSRTATSVIEQDINFAVCRRCSIDRSYDGFLVSYITRYEVSYATALTDRFSYLMTLLFAPRH